MGAPDEKKIPIICGPTGSGKSAAAIELAREFPVEIVSADSRQIIKHLDIGTAKPTREERRQVEVHLLDLIEPGERYSAYRYIDDAGIAIEKVLSAGKIPVVVGGTGLYLRALTEGVVEIDSDDNSVREKLEQDMNKIGSEEMHEKLKAVDPAEAGRIHPNNKVRVIRALEIYHLTGKPKSELIAEGAYKRCDHAFEYFCLAPPRERLYERINQRVDRMMAGGLLEEVSSLLASGLENQLRKANVIGYSELLDHINGNLSLPEAVNSIKQNSRRYAKRQLTWFRKQAGCAFFEDSESLLASAGKLFRLWRN